MRHRAIVDKYPAGSVTVDLEWLDSMSGKPFELFLAQRSSGVQVGALAGYRSALHHLYTEARRPIPVWYGHLATFIRGAKKKTAKQNQDAGASDSGMSDVPFTFYKELMELLVTGGPAGLADQIDVWFPTYLASCFNLMCRSSSTQHLHISRTEVNEDAINVYHARTKTDGTATTPARRSASSPTRCARRSAGGSRSA
jgi:hypothetical protein